MAFAPQYSLSSKDRRFPFLVLKDRTVFAPRVVSAVLVAGQIGTPFPGRCCLPSALFMVTSLMATDEKSFLNEPGDAAVCLIVDRIHSINLTIVYEYN